MKSRILHLQTLIDKGACSDQVKLFRERFGKSVRVTEALCVRAAPDFDWNWAAQHLLSAPAHKAYNDACAPAQKAYNEARAPAQVYNEARATAQKAYDEATAPARKVYNEARATAWKAFDEDCAPAQKVYDEARATAWKAFDEAIATAFARAYLGDKNP